MNKAILQIQNKVDEYSREYRRAGSPPFKVGLPYSLFPATLGALLSLEKLSGKWPDAWPDGDSGGIYFVFDVDMTLLYIGKASMNNTLGARLSHYFKIGSDGCMVVGTWSADPKYIATLPIANQRVFEAASLEEYLIWQLHPPDNTQGKER